MITPDAKFFDDLGPPPWSDEHVLSMLKARNIRRILPVDQQAFTRNCTLSPIPCTILGKIRELGIVIDLGNGEKLC